MLARGDRRLAPVLEYAVKHGARLDGWDEYFNYSYEFNSSGEIVTQRPRHFTDRNANETDRYCRIAIEAVYDYNEKENRNSTPDLVPFEIQAIDRLCGRINCGTDIGVLFNDLRQIVENIQHRLIETSYPR